MSVDITQLVSELFAAWNDHDPDRAVSLFAADYQGQDVGRAQPELGPQDEQQRMMRYFQAFPDLSFRAEDILVQGERAAVVWTAHGTHQGSLMNIPATGRRVVVRGMSFLTIQGEKIARAMYVWDVAGLLRSIGLLPEL